MRAIRWQLILGFCLLPALAMADPAPASLAPLDLEFSGYRFGQSPSANMSCFSGFCKSQAPGGDGRVTFPFSVYETPGAVSTLAGLTVVNPRYTYWEDRLFRVVFHVDCGPLEGPECVDDIASALDREYDLIPLVARDMQEFAKDRRVLSREFLAGSGALVKIRAYFQSGTSHPPLVDIQDMAMTDLVGTTLNPDYKPKKIELQDIFRQH